MVKEYYHIKTSYCNYYAEIWHQYPTIDKVYFGGKKKCVTYSIYLEEDDTPNLDGLGYDENCNTSADLIKSKGTKHMLATSMMFLKHKYKTSISTSIQLKDSSTITCDGGYEMKLPYYYMLYHHQTWYQKQFKAFPTSSYWATKLSSDTKVLKESLLSKPDAQDIFQTVKNIKKRQYLETLYSECLNVKELVTKLKELDCFVLRGWAEDFVAKIMPYLSTIDWTITRDFAGIPERSNIISLGSNKPHDMFIHTGGSTGVGSIDLMKDK